MNTKGYILALSLTALSLIGQGITFAGEGHKVSDKALHMIGEKVGHLFDYEPFDPPLKNHLWMKTDPDKMTFFHFEKPVSEKENQLLFMGEAVKGRFCSEDQPEGGKTGYVHFHSAQKAEAHQHGHGGEKGQDGYWLRHVALGEFDMMKMHFTPGLAHNFMPTPPPACK